MEFHDLSLLQMHPEVVSLLSISHSDARAFLPWPKFLRLAIKANRSNEGTMGKKQLTTAAGRPVGDNQNSLTVGPRGPGVFEDFLLFEKMALFNRERIPERVVHAKGSGAYAYFVCTNPEISKYTTAQLLSAKGKTTPTV